MFYNSARLQSARVGIRINDIRYADDVDLLAERKRGLQCLVDELQASIVKLGLQVNTNKSNVVVFERETNCRSQSTVDTDILECVNEFVHRLGSVITKVTTVVQN